MSVDSQLAKLETCKFRRAHGDVAAVEKILLSLKTFRCSGAESLVRFHDALLFLRAFPQSRKVVELTEKLLAGIPAQVARLMEADADLELLDSEQFSGIAGTTLSDTFTYDVALWLAQRYPDHVSADWDFEEQARQLAISLPRLMPLLADDSLVEADPPFARYLENVAGSVQQILPWLLRTVAATDMQPLEKTAWYDALRVRLLFKADRASASRTLSRHNPPQMYFHREPLIQRSQVSLEKELKSVVLPLRKLSRSEGEQLLDKVRAALTVRYRELHGTTRGDPETVVEADVGRGVHIFLWGLPPQRRLPLRAYYAGITFKNGVPINYIEAIGLFEWMEVGFNTFYAFREGETAWIYSKVLHLIHQLGDITCFSVYPYQLGHENEEAIKSGAFWFYRKLGFQPGNPELLALTKREEAKIKINSKPGYRTSARVLRKLAAEHVFYEFGDEVERGLWRRFSVRNIGLAVQQRIAGEFGGNPEKMQLAAASHLEKILKVKTASWDPCERAAFESFAFVLWLVPELNSWTDREKQALLEVIRAKAKADESDYLRLLQRHEPLRRALVALGSAQTVAKKRRYAAKPAVTP